MTDIAPSAGQHRLEALDGVRGIAALSVVVFQGGNLNVATAGLVALASLALCIGLAAATRPVDLMSIRLANRIARLVLRDEPARLAPMPS